MEKKEWYLKKTKYQEAINEIIEKLNGKKFCKAHFAQAISVSRERARQIIDIYKLDVPTRDLLKSNEFQKLKILVDSDVKEFSLEDLYKKFNRSLPKDFIRSYVFYKNKIFKESKHGVLKLFLKSVNVEEFTLEELFLEFLKTYPSQSKDFNYWSFSVYCYARNIKYKRIRNQKTKITKNEELLQKMVSEFSDFIKKNDIDCSLYSISQIVHLYKELGGVELSISKMRQILLKCGSGEEYESVKSIALNNRLKTLNIDLKNSSKDEIVKVHNEKYKLTPIDKKDLVNWYCIFLINGL